MESQKLFRQLRFPTHVANHVNLALNKKALAFKTRAFVLELDYVFISKKRLDQVLQYKYTINIVKYTINVVHKIIHLHIGTSVIGLS
jgi:hypothetical protein